MQSRLDPRITSVRAGSPGRWRPDPALIPGPTGPGSSPPGRPAAPRPATPTTVPGSHAWTGGRAPVPARRRGRRAAPAPSRSGAGPPRPLDVGVAVAGRADDHRTAPEQPLQLPLRRRIQDEVGQVAEPTGRGHEELPS